MEIPADIFLTLVQTLERSIQERVGGLDLLMYNPDTDSVKGVVSFEYLSSHGLVHSSAVNCEIDDAILRLIRMFNEGEVRTFSMNGVRIEGTKRYKVIPNYTHPLPDQDIFPSKKDRAEIERWGAPAVIVGSRGAREEYGLKPPFVAAYLHNGGLNYANGPVNGRSPYKLVLGAGEHTTGMQMQLVRVSPFFSQARITF